MLTRQTIFVLDAHGLLYQLFHALPPMSSPMGEPVGAVYGFTKDRVCQSFVGVGGFPPVDIGFVTG